jgi:sugar lactone lactonase YvrE
MLAELLPYHVAPVGAPSWRESRLVHTFDKGWPGGMAIDPDGATWVALLAADRIDVIDTAGTATGCITLARWVISHQRVRSFADVTTTNHHIPNSSVVPAHPRRHGRCPSRCCPGSLAGQVS